MKKIFVCSPLKGDEIYNTRIAVELGKKIYLKGYLPIVPHFYSDIIAPGLRDDIQKDRRKLLAISKSMLKGCDEIWVFGKFISKGMQEEINLAKKLKIKIKYFPNLIIL